ncbi:hypothetical protein LTR05_007174 [Lithohypha guttulata]|uniref:Uncharacterized protein n=1 Tax=Lithohypha guttulata TaxID=1690604 RepID=A0AAN7SUN7_9EURO|nr:hypothetical protein LTR05_007174 [Lithohypha guttulata]
MNGTTLVTEQQRSITPSVYLGKRKRSLSPEKPIVNSHSHNDDSDIDSIIREIKKYDIASSILQYPVPGQPDDAPVAKKLRTDFQDNTVEARVNLGLYSSSDALLADLRQVVTELRQSQPLPNGKTHKSDGDDTLSQLDRIDDVVAQYTRGSLRPSPSSQGTLLTRAGQVLTVRSNVEGGAVKQLFTGLRIQPSSNVRQQEIDLKKLPSGFDIVEAATVDPGHLSAQTVARTFGEVFQQQRNARQLESPKPSRYTHTSTLKFTKPFENVTTTSKDDYRATPLTAGSWLEYSNNETNVTKPPSRRNKINDDPEALFNTVFSSFAPSEDNTTAIIPRSDRGRLWYRKHGQQAMQRIIPLPGKHNSLSSSDYPHIDDDFQQVIDDYVPVSIQDAQPDAEEHTQDADDMLNEVSDLLQTLSSCQNLRDLDKSGTTDHSNKPDSLELDTFDLLRQQLKILVASLPPFAVAKLDGEQLKALNVSTNIIVRTPDVSGTAQPDEGTLHRQRVAQSQQIAATRATNPTPARASYTGPAPNTGYNTQARSYGTSATQPPTLPGYAQRNVQMYNTPRPNVATAPYTQTPAFNRPQQPYPGATIQQYQRLQNGYGQAQNNAQYNRSASPAKPLVNGHSYAQQTVQPPNIQPQRNQYSTPAQSNPNLLQGAYAQANTHATIQQIKAAQQQGQNQYTGSQSPQPQSVQHIQQQRQASGTPQPQQNAQSYIQNQSVQATQPGQSVVTNAANGLAAYTTQAAQQRTTVTPQPTPAAPAQA